MTSLKDKLTQALNETRMLILGAQILLGFQFQAAFQPGFDKLAPVAQWLDAAALGLIVVAVALLIAPCPFHRLVEQGRDTQRMHGYTTTMAEAALLPFAITIGIDIDIVGQALLGGWAGAALGLGLTGFAALFWYGIEALPRHSKGAGMMTGQPDGEANTRTSLREKINTMLTEARVILPGAQALLGFQFVAVLTSGFEQLADIAKLLHLASLALVALAVILLMSPAAYHRLAADGEDRPDVQRFGSAVVLASLGPLALGISGEVTVVVQKIAASGEAGLAAGLLSLAVFGTLWFGYPLMARAERHRGKLARADEA
jgi:hypothetical protein